MSTNVSFRDPAGSVIVTDQQAFRIIQSQGRPDFESFVKTKAAQKFITEGSLSNYQIINNEKFIQSLSEDEVIPECPEDSLILEHPRIFFRTYPYEWPPEMLFAAAQLTIDLALDVFSESFQLKDATPYNILFSGPRPIFIDLLSFEKHEPTNYIWVPYGQFLRTFIRPLMANKYFGIPLNDIFLTRRDGLEPDELYDLCSAFQRLIPPFLTMVSLPKWLKSFHNPDNQSIYQPQQTNDPERAGFIFRATLRKSRKLLTSLKPSGQKTSLWSNYTITNNYSDNQFTSKVEFVQTVLAKLKPEKVLDIGCNTGHFSKMAAQNGATVVAIDYDPVVVGRLWQDALQNNLDILPIVVNLTRPTPAVGWRNEECLSFLERAKGRFDMVFMLAVVHHLIVTERVPLEEVFALATELTTKWLVIEYVGPKDSMFQRLLRGRERLYQFFNRDYFENALNQSFEIILTKEIADSDRVLYLLQKKG